VHDEPKNPIDELKEFRDNYDAFIRRLSAEWAGERDSDPHGIDDGQYILRSASDDLVTFRSQIVHGLEDICEKLDAAVPALRAMQRFQVYMDGGRSFRAFWEAGDKIIGELKGLSTLLRERIGGDAA